MSFFILLVLGAVQGLTEFLPVSSSGHLVIFENLFNVECDVIFLNVILHLGTLFAVMIAYRKQLLELIKRPFQKKMWMLIVATLPAGLFVLLFEKFVTNSFGGEFLWIGFFITAALLVFAEYVTKHTAPKSLTFTTAIFMGAFQAFAIFPGISRSGATLACGLACGKDKNQVLDFSFLMSIPIILASMLFECLKVDFANLGLLSVQITLALVVSFLFGLLSIKITMQVTKGIKLYWFSIYLFLVGILLLFFKL